VKSELPVLQFGDAAAFAAWLDEHPTSPGLWLKLARQGGPETTVSKAEAIDCALCHGWIDGQIARFDAAFFLTRFTPRSAKSRWSAANRRRAEELTAADRIPPRGLAAIAAARADGRWDAAYPSASKAEAPEDFLAAVAADPRAAEVFDGLDSANRYALLYRLHHAPAGARRDAMIVRFVAMLARGETFHPPRERRSAKSSNRKPD
jgi:uncharacterized protein YdeI (YjbR/CyaY-like superfamily)